MGHAQIIKHAAGWVEGGLCAPLEKFIIDIDMLHMTAETLKPLKVSVATLAPHATTQAGHGGHCVGTTETLAKYITSFY